MSATGLVRFALLLSIASAAARAGTPIEFVQPFLEPGEFAVSHHVAINSEAYDVIYVNATPAFVVRELGSAYAFLNDSSQIHAVLLADFLATVDVAGQVSNLNASIDSFKRSRAASETDCGVLTGTHDAACRSEDACFQSCISVPACRAYNQGSGGDLVREILAWQNEKALLDGNISLYEGNLSIVASRTSQIDVAASSMETLLSRFNAPIAYLANVTRLFRSCPNCFGYCMPIPFDLHSLAVSGDAVTLLRSKLQPISGLASQAESVRRETVARTQKSAFATFIMGLQATADSLSGRAASVFPRVHDAQAEYNLTRIRQIASQAAAFGEQKDFDAAYALEPEFLAISAALASRLSEIEATLSRFDSMEAEVTADFLNATANANTALAQINDSELAASIEKLRNITNEMKARANASRYADAFELEDDYYWESANANARITNLTLLASEISALRENAIALVTRDAEALRPNDADLRARQENLSAALTRALTAARAPIPFGEAHAVKQALLAVSSDATELSGYIGRVHAVGDRKAAYAQAETVFANRFLSSARPW